MNKVKRIIFDLGGILVPETGELINTRLADYLSLSPHKLSGCTRKYKRQTVSGKITLLEMYSHVVQDLVLTVSPEDILRHHLAIYRETSTEHNTDMVDLVRLLRKYCGVDCLTNIEIEVADVCRETGLFDYFCRAYLSTELGMQKPDREIYIEVLRNIECSPIEVVFVDDRRENIEGAK